MFKKFFNRDVHLTLKGVYTVEASVVLSICFILFGVAVGVSYHVFDESMTSIVDISGEFDAVKTFRARDDFKEIVNTIKRKQ